MKDDISNFINYLLKHSWGSYLPFLATVFLLLLSFFIKKLTNKPKRKAPKRILITGANGNIGYSLAFMIAQGNMLGNDQEVILHLFEIPLFEKHLQGVKLELIDCAFPLLKDVVATADPIEAFKDIDFAILCGAKPRLQGMERKDLLKANVEIFKQQGNYFDQYAKKDVKVCVVGNPANTNCLALIKNAPSINPNNFTALTRLDHNRLLAQVGSKLKVTDYSEIKNIAIWGNHSSTQYPYIDYSMYNNKRLNNIFEKSWIEGELISSVQQRGAQILEKRNLSSVASAAKAICEHMRDWVNGTNEWVSMGVYSRGEYGSDKDIVFSYPVTCQNGEWKIVEDLKLSDFAKSKLKLTSDELTQEKELAFS